MGFDPCKIKNWVAFLAASRQALHQTTDGPLSYADNGRCESDIASRLVFPSLFSEIAARKAFDHFSSCDWANGSGGWLKAGQNRPQEISPGNIKTL